MNHHTIELQAFTDWKADKEVEYAFSSLEKKRITVSLNGTIAVYHGGEIVWQGIQPFGAIEAYNGIDAPPEKMNF